MSSEQPIVYQDFQSAPEAVNLNLPSEYDTSPEVLQIPEPESRPGDIQKEPDLNIGHKQPKGKIWGMKRKTFMIVLGIVILLIIAVAAGVGGGVGATAAKSDNNNGQGSSTPIYSSRLPTPTSDHPPVVTVTTSYSSPPTPTPIRQNTPLAAVNWNTSNLNIQLFYKHTDGSIRLQENSGLEWGEQSPQITKPKDNSGFAAIGWLEGEVRQVRVYTASENNALTESVWNSSSKLWYDQDISTGRGIAPLAAGSQLTAYTWFENGTHQIRVYYQGQDGYIREAVFDNTKGWSKGDSPTIQDFPRAKNGTGLAIVSFPDTNEREAKLYYQNMDGKLVSYDYKPAATWVQSWQNSTVDHGSVSDGTYLTAVAGILATGELVLRIYFIQDGKLVETWWTRKAGWVSWNMHDAAAPGISAVSYSGEHVYVFFQDKAEYLSAFSLNRDPNSVWNFTAII
ncbi:hypothetical protein B9Z19DRAFT_1068978 [Tuber borchii]|uniref:Uncharacterized protein n=1 Tax=Tuber borchii TaxID=42251 RepID=A0A2T6ZDA0_TUBBO|nr:hypothetical protein B9Z19DRAFT_1068978 [Tuber borchii]